MPLTPSHESIPDWFITEAHWLSVAMRDFLTRGQEIAKRYVRAIDKDATFHDFIKVQYPDIPVMYWRRMEKVGRGQLDIRILAGNTSYGNKLERLPMSEQKRALDDRLPLLLDNGDVLQVSISDIRPRQADQLFSFEHIRDLAAQRAFLEEQRLEEDNKNRKNTSSVVVEVDGGRILSRWEAYRKEKTDILHQSLVRVRHALYTRETKGLEISQ